jgi:hypothetical protein
VSSSNLFACICSLCGLSANTRIFIFILFLFLINVRSVFFFYLAATNNPENVKAICENTLVLYLGVCREVFRKLKRRARNRVATSARRGMTLHFTPQMHSK